MTRDLGRMAFDYLPGENDAPDRAVLTVGGTPVGEHLVIKGDWGQPEIMRALVRAWLADEHDDGSDIGTVGSAGHTAARTS